MRVMVIGNSGGGKTTLCATLKTLLQLPHYPLDKLIWQSGWKKVALPEYTRRHRRLIQEEEWLIDGWGDWSSVVERVAAASVIIVIDLPLWRHYCWAAKRQVEDLFWPRTDLPSGCRMLPVTWKLMKMIWQIDRTEMPKLRRLLQSDVTANKTVLWINTRRQIRALTNGETPIA